MNLDVNPYRSIEANIDAKDFEVFCTETLKAYAKTEGLQNFQIKHNQKINADDGTYQIDVLAEFVALGAKHVVIVECKKVGRSIERETVAALYAKLQSIGAQKGILISTSGFQSGAVQYAGKHGIALWQVFDNYIRHIRASAYNERFPLEELILASEAYLPKHFVKEWDAEIDFPSLSIYPTSEMRQAALEMAMKADNRNWVYGR